MNTGVFRSVCMCVCDSKTPCAHLRSENNNLSPKCVYLYVLPQCFCRFLLLIFLLYFRAAFVIQPQHCHTITTVCYSSGFSSCFLFHIYIYIQPPSLMLKISPTICNTILSKHLCFSHKKISLLCSASTFHK